MRGRKTGIGEKGTSALVRRQGRASRQPAVNALKLENHLRAGLDLWPFGIVDVLDCVSADGGREVTRTMRDQEERAMHQPICLCDVA